jgi:hypothetical protein
VPVFTATLDEDGAPRRRAWEQIEASHSEVDKWRPGKALCAHTGVAFDVLDIDPRHGGAASYRKLRAELGREPDIYAKVQTRSNGLHAYTPLLGLGIHHPIPGYPGLDLQGKGAMVFIPPTHRLDGYYILKAEFLEELANAEADTGLARLLRKALAAVDGPSPNGSGGRADTDKLRATLLAAPDGGQRDALLAYTSELERRYEREDVKHVLLGLLGVLKSYDRRKPWNERSILSGLHRPGEIIPDARPGELDFEEPKRPGTMRSFADTGRRRVEWLWPGYLARGEFTVLDGEKGCGKSLVLEDIAARLSRGDAMPGEETGTGEVITTAIFTAESDAESEVGPRLDAAGAIGDHIFCERADRNTRGKAAGLVLPGSGPAFGRRIREVEAGLAIWDPINDYLDETISTNNDASIRRALGPLGPEIRNRGCAGVLVRHMNKDTRASARMRGAGTTAYQNRARVHLVIGRLPQGAHPIARFGLAVVDSNLRRVAPGSLAYDIEDSDIPADYSGGMVARIVWYGRVPVDADALVRGDSVGRRGPDPYVERQAIGIVRKMFAGTDTVASRDILAALVAEDISTDSNLLDRIKDALKAVSVAGKGKDHGKWFWTTRDLTHRRRG